MYHTLYRKKLWRFFSARGTVRFVATHNALARTQTELAQVRARAGAAMRGIRSNAEAAISDLRGKNARKIADLRMTMFVGGLGGLAGGIAAGQIARLAANAQGTPEQKKRKVAMARFGAYLTGFLGLVGLYRAKSKTAIGLASVAVGVGTGQATLDSRERDLIPGKY